MRPVAFHSRALAVKRVTHNQGKNTPGVDGAIWSTPASKYKAIDTLKRRGYQPRPLRRVYILKINRKAEAAGNPHDERPARCRRYTSIGFTLFRLNDTNDVVPTCTPGAFVSVCCKCRWKLWLVEIIRKWEKSASLWRTLPPRRM
jgi:hypothetical protein